MTADTHASAFPISDFFDPIKSSEILQNLGAGTTPAYLARLRHEGGGPIFFRIGRSIYYRRSDLYAWAASKVSGPFASTSDRGEAA